MRIAFPYAGYEKIAPIDVPEENLMGLFEPKASPEVDSREILRRAFEAPYGSPRLKEMVKKTDQILVLIDDGTRFTPIPPLLAEILRELHAAGLKDDQIEILTAQGTHRKMSEDELFRKLGEYRGRFRVHQHDYKDQKSLHDFGETKDGTRVEANKLLAGVDLTIGLGSIVPHRVKGFGGGAKIAFPGVSGKEIMERNQWEASMHMSETVMGVAENPMRYRMEEAAALAGLRFIANLVLDRDARIVGCFCGHPVHAHRAGCKLSREINAVHLPHRAEIVVIDAHPADRDFWQSAKAAYAGTLAVEEGGTMIIVAPNPEGVANNHPNMLEIGYRPHAEIVKMVQAGEIDDLIGAAILADVAQIIDHARLIMVSPGVGKKDVERLGMHWAPDANAALRLAFDTHGKKAKVAVIRQGGHALPIAGARAV
jgi:nickel-dependent lactate racemase